MGYRAYLQSYASYQLKKIFDVNALDLNKVAKAFGFKVPPRVNLVTGPGKGQSARVGEKRRREESEEEEETDEESKNEEGVRDEDGKRKRGWQGEKGSVRGPMRGRQGKTKRLETLGKKAVDKEKFRKSKEMKALGCNWSR